jgi:hypothetical protein
MVISHPLTGREFTNFRPCRNRGPLLLRDAALARLMLGSFGPSGSGSRAILE